MKSHSGMLQTRYRREAIRAMAPKDRLYLTYDLVWKAVNEGDADKALQLLLLLRKAIRIEENPLAALNALRLYRHCEWLISEKQDLPSVAHVFFELKRALGGAVDYPDSPEFLARRDKIEASPDLLYFGKHGRHYSSRPRRNKAEEGKAESVPEVQAPSQEPHSAS
jgi:hypothetical protein